MAKQPSKAQTLLNEFYRKKLNLPAGDYGENAQPFFKAMAGYQTRYSKMGVTPCIGAERTSHNGYNRCRKPFCPMCWHRKHKQILDTLCALNSDQPRVYYLRATDWLKWDEADIPLKVLKRFRAKNTKLHLVCHSMNFEADEITINQDEVDLGIGDPFQGQIGVSLLGVFYSEGTEHYQPRSRLNSRVKHSMVIDRKAGVHLGTVDCYPFSCLDEVIDAWLEKLHPPWEYRMHNIFDQYVCHFDKHPYPMGRSWAFAHVPSSTAAE